MGAKAEKTKKRKWAIIGLAFLFAACGWLFLNRKESTRKLATFHKRHPISFLHIYGYLKWMPVYLRPIKYVLEHPKYFPRWLYNRAGNRLMQTHHSKVITIDTAKQLIDIKEPIRVSNPENVLPFERARDIILDNPNSIAVMDCSCRQISSNPCQPLDVCMVLGEPFVSFVVEHKKGRSRRVDVNEALEILEREHKRGRVHTAWFKDVAGDRLYSICNCCSCCCLGIKGLKHGFEVVASSGYTAKVDNDTCTLCDTCRTACQFEAIDILVDSIYVNEDKCKGCGVCAEVCPTNAISLHEDVKKPSPLFTHSSLTLN
ncbi:MAG: 4Fe-4S binding protein [Actinomycetota bacterium]|nr:4Fe-4S binding protein [Actinomycetota bacterium]